MSTLGGKSNQFHASFDKPSNRQSLSLQPPVAQPPKTNRDLYLAITAFSKKHTASNRTLERYLLALLSVAERFEAQTEFTLSELVQILECGFTAAVSAFHEDWREQYDQLPHESAGYAGWRATAIRQIVDLRELTESGKIHDKFAGFGIDAPRGGRWYNFDPCQYLECAMAGTFGGWDLADGNRIALTTEATADAEVSIPSVTWDDFTSFVVCGQMYE